MRDSNQRRGGRPATGGVLERRRATGTVYALRFTAYGERRYVTLEGCGSRADAERELRHVLADVDRGVWRPPAPAPTVVAPEDPTFHEFASDWWAAKKPTVEPTTRNAYENELIVHLLPFFHAHHLSQITVAEVDRYREHKVREGQERAAAIDAARDARERAVAEAERDGTSVRAAKRATPIPRPLGAEHINKTLTRLGQILDVAEERELIDRNPLRINPKNRKLKVKRKRPVHLDSAVHIAALIQAAAELDAEPGARTSGRRALVATLVFAGPRVTEACELPWREVNLAAGRIGIGKAKTEAGMRDVDILPVLRDELTSYRAGRRGRDGHSDLVFTTAAGTPRDKDNVRTKVLEPVIARANQRLEEAGEVPLPAGLTAHKLRHTFTSILFALGKDPVYVMQQLGHADPKFTLRVYAHMMRRSEEERLALKALVEGGVSAPIGTSDVAALSAAA